ncbi:MAG: DUF922 domain-containing Zn-dependent protease [Anaerolineales bacterium]|nr:DUF922 domain-containing Zn-dependent protease [Anaerolineales bacterium]
MQFRNRNTPFCCLGGLLAASTILAACISLALLAALQVGGGRGVGQAAGSEVDIPISIRTVYYRIEGDTAQELRSQMDQFGPLDEQGRRWSALTRWCIRWSYRYRRGVGRCAVGPLKVELEITYHMPQWEPPDSAPDELVERWRAYLAALQVHEEGHAEIAKQAAKAVQQSMQALPVYPTCQTMERDADALGGRILEEYLRLQDEYDRQTEYGCNQGACFP